MAKPKSEQIKTLKKDFLEKTNALNRINANAFNINRVKADINYLRAYLFQLMTFLNCMISYFIKFLGMEKQILINTFYKGKQII